MPKCSEDWTYLGCSMLQLKCRNVQGTGPTQNVLRYSYNAEMFRELNLIRMCHVTFQADLAGLLLHMTRNGDLNTLLYSYLCILRWKKLHGTVVIWCSLQPPPARHMFDFPDIRMNIPIKSRPVSLSGFIICLLLVVLTARRTDGGLSFCMTWQSANNYRKFFIQTSDLHPILPHRLQYAVCAMTVRNLD
jgi:hypothetical protein